METKVDISKKTADSLLKAISNSMLQIGFIVGFIFHAIFGLYGSLICLSLYLLYTYCIKDKDIKTLVKKG